MSSDDRASITRFPLEWPIGWKRTPRHQRQRAAFRSTKTDVSTRPDGAKHTVKRELPVSVFVATQRLERQIEMLGGRQPTLSTNVSLRLDGRPRSEGEPSDPGVALYFSFKGKAAVFACDKFDRVGDNIAAIAAHVDALRRVDRYGVGTIEQALAGYKALPADSAANWRAVLGFGADTRPSVDQVDTAFKQLARAKHPDVGGDDASMAHLNRARAFAFAELDGAEA
jgi:hypothetical protein